MHCSYTAYSYSYCSIRKKSLKLKNNLALTTEDRYKYKLYIHVVHAYEGR